MDIYIGLGILFPGIFIWAEMFWMAGIFIPVLLPSFQLYIVLTFVAMVAAQFANLPFWIALAMLYGMIAFIGMLILIRFLQQNPIKK